MNRGLNSCALAVKPCLEPIRLALVLETDTDYKTVEQIAGRCDWLMSRITETARVGARLKELRPSVLLTGYRPHTSDWRQVLHVAQDAAESPSVIVIADVVSPKLRYIASHKGARGVLARPLDEVTTMRAVVQGWAEWSRRTAR